MDRLSLLRRLVTPESTYLEIGAFEGVLFRQISTARAIAVDPEPNIPWIERMSWHLPGRPTRRRFVRATSDAFFARPHRWIRQHGIDVAFVDGLHTHEQVVVDVQNVLRYLNQGGAIVLHDTNPTSAAMAYRARSYEEAKAHAREGKVPGWSWEWCGDVWKAVLRIRMEIPGLRVETVKDDYGLTIIRRAPGSPVWPGPGRPVADLGYADLDAHRAEWLNVVTGDG